MKSSSDPHGIGFVKMHGLGNDFVVIDRRVPEGQTAAHVTPALVRALGDRHRGVGFDQLAVIDADDKADVRLTFYNADGSLSGACGNATRCIARREMTLRDVSRLTLRTDRGVLLAEDAGGGLTRVNMGHPETGWRDIPLAHEADTLHLPIEGSPVATGMGNPHCTFFVPDIKAVQVEKAGPHYEHHALFPQRTNVEFVQVLSPTSLRLRIWERGTGVTLASGSCACAAAVAAARRGLAERSVRVQVDGGTLKIDWRADGVWMIGPTMQVFSGWIGADFLAGIA